MLFTWPQLTTWLHPMVHMLPRPREEMEWRVISWLVLQRCIQCPVSDHNCYNIISTDHKIQCTQTWVQHITLNGLLPSWASWQFSSQFQYTCFTGKVLGFEKCHHSRRPWLPTERRLAAVFLLVVPVIQIPLKGICLNGPHKRPEPDPVERYLACSSNNSMSLACRGLGWDLHQNGGKKEYEIIDTGFNWLHWFLSQKLLFGDILCADLRFCCVGLHHCTAKLGNNFVFLCHFYFDIMLQWNLFYSGIYLPSYTYAWCKNAIILPSPRVGANKPSMVSLKRQKDRILLYFQTITWQYSPMRGLCPGGI